MSRADKLYTVLADGRRHSRHEIFRACGEFFLTNNAASELRAKRGLDVTHTVEDGEHFYQLAPLGSATGSPSSASPPVAEPSVAEALADGTSGRPAALTLFDTERSAA